MPTKWRKSKVILCATLTADGKMDDSEPAVPPALYDGDMDPARHPWAALFDGAAGILMDPAVAATLPLPQAAVRSVLIVHLERAVDMDGAQLRAELLGALRRLSEGSSGPVLCFGGAELFRALLDVRLVDELCLLVRPVIDGRRGSAALSGEGGGFFPASVACRLIRMEPHGDECLLHYRILRKSPAPA